LIEGITAFLRDLAHDLGSGLILKTAHQGLIGEDLSAQAVDDRLKGHRERKWWFNAVFAGIASGRMDRFDRDWGTDRQFHGYAPNLKKSWPLSIDFQVFNELDGTGGAAGL
jgi:hypothetical protein